MPSASSTLLAAPDSRIDLLLLKEAVLRRNLRTRPRALLIEDQRIFRQIVIEILSRECDVITAANGKDGLRLYAESAPDIVFLDIELPDINGQKILSAIAEADAGSFVVMVTGNQSLEEIEKAMRQGAKGYIVKPFTRQKIEEYLAHLRKLTGRV